MSSSGKIEYQVIVNDAGVAGKVGAVNNSLKTVGTNAKTAATGTGSLNTSLNQVGNTSSTVATKTKGMTGAFSGFKSAISGMAGKGLALSLGIAGVASQIASIADSYDNLRDTELKLNTMRTATTKSGNIVTGMEIRLAKMRKEGKQGTAEYALLEKKLITARETQKNKTNNLANAEDDYQRAQRAFYLQIGPQIIGIGAQMASSLLLMKTYSGGAAEGMKQMGTASKILGTAMKAIPLVAIAGAILAIRTNAFGFRDALEAVGVKIGQILPGLKPFLDWVHDMGEALGLTGGNLDMGKAFDLLKTGFTGALDTIMNTDWSKVIGDLVNNIAHFLQTADWKEVWKEFQNAIFAGGSWVYDRLNEIGKKIVDWFNTIKWDDVWNAFRSALFAGGTWVATQLKGLYEKIHTWIIAQDWLAIWKRFQDALFAGGEWVGTQLASIVQWLKDNAPDKLKEAGTIITNATVAAVNSPEAKIATGALDTWAAGAVKSLGDSLVTALKSATAFLKGGTVSTQLQTNFETAGSAIDWIKVGSAWLKAALTNVGIWEWNTFGKTIMESFRTTFQIYAALVDFKSAAFSLLTNFGNWIGGSLAGGIQSITDAGKALVIEFGKAILAAVSGFGKWATDIINAIGNSIGGALGGSIAAILDAGKAFIIELGKAIITAVTGDKKIGPDTLAKFAEAIKSAPVNVLTGVGKWIWEQVTGGIGALAGQFTEFIKGQKAEAGTPGGGGVVKQEVTPGVNNQIAMGQMTSILEWWKRIASDIQGIRPVLFINDITAKALILGVQEYWKQIGSNIQGIAPVLPLNSEGALALILAVQEYWKKIGGNIQGLVPQLTANNTSAIQIMDAVMKRWQSAVSTIAGMKPALSANNTAALAAEKAVEVNWRGYANAIQKVIPKITVNNSQALSAIKAVQNAMNSVKNVSRTITITTRYVTVGRPAAHNITGIQAHNIAGVGQTTAVAPLIGGGNMTNNVIGGGQGDVNVTINMRDEFGIEKQRKFKAVLGKDRYVFGSVGAGG